MAQTDTMEKNTWNIKGRGERKMNFLEERIVKDGIVKEGNVLKVDSFLNHQMDIELFDQIGAEFKKRFADKNINKILTIEASGIGIACIVAKHFSCAGRICKKISEHQSGRGDVCSRSRIIYPQMQEPGNCSKEISFRGRSCAHY